VFTLTSVPEGGSAVPHKLCSIEEKQRTFGYRNLESKRAFAVLLQNDKV
jgi:hypothetical protein